MSFLRNYGVNTNINGTNGFGAIPPITIYNTQLAATTNKTLTVPSLVGMGKGLTTNAKVLAVFGYQASATVFVANGSDATPDTSGSLASETAIINPSAWIVAGGSTLAFYPIAQAYVSVAFYAVG